MKIAFAKLRFEQREAQQHRIPHARPNRLHDVRVDGGALHQHRVDADANHDQKRLKPQREQRLEIVLPDAAPFVIGHRGQRDAAARHKLLDALAFRAGVVVAVAFEQVDRAPYGKACADGGDEGLQYVDCAVEEFHCVDLMLLFLEKHIHFS